jgi:methyl-accepting chemotaxis protein
MVKLRNLKVRSQMILLGSTAIIGFIVFGLMSFYTITKIKVNGSIYKNIVQGKDLIADILPPPEYIIESYLTILQVVDESNPATKKKLIEKFSQLRKEFEERHEFWQKDLPESQIKELITKKSYIPAMAFYEKAEKELFPAIMSNDSSKARKVVIEMKKDYETHRQTVDELVKMANERTSNDESSAAKIIRNETIMLIIIMCITIAATAVIIYFIAHNLLNAIGGEPTYIAEVAQKVADGDLTVRLENSGEMTGIYAAMSVMLDGLKKLVLNIKGNSQTIASASEQLSAAAEQMSRGITEQSGRASQIAASSTEMSQTVIDIAQNAASIATEAVETGNLAKEGKNIVGQSVSESEAIAKVVSESSDKIGTLGDQSNKIGEIVNVIKDIADQTNLLALNAAIEAARAGEQGRGFAVVADEVRKLAERTSKATSEIASVITAIQNEIGYAVDSMGQTTQKVVKGVELSTKAGTALDNIVRSIEALQDKVQHIASATEEMSTTSESISSDIENIATVSGETSSSSNQIAQSSTDLARLSEDLRQLVVTFKV